MKRFYALLSVLIFMLCGCSSENPQSSAEVSQETTETILIPLYEPEIDFYIPSDFQRTSTENNQTAYICSDASIIVNEDFQPENVTGLNSYVTYSEELYKAFTDKYEVLSRKETNINGLDAILLEFVYELDGENGTLSKTCLVGFYLEEQPSIQRFYIVTCKADTENYDSYKNEFLKTVQSVKYNP